MLNKTKRFLKIAVLVGVLIGVLLWVGTCAWSPYSGLFWLWAPREQVKVLVPVGYEGPVLIAYQVPDGLAVEKADDVWLYQLQPDGVLLLQNDPPRYVVQISFWYVAEDGTMQPIPYSDCFNDSVEKGVVVCTGMMAEIFDYRELRPNQGFYIGHLNNDTKRTWDQEGSDQLIRHYLDRLVLPEQR